MGPRLREGDVVLWRGYAGYAGYVGYVGYAGYAGIAVFAMSRLVADDLTGVLAVIEAGMAGPRAGLH